MKQMQEKSPCCQGQVWRFGERRRQCSVCRKTWQSWAKKRGRKVRRSDGQLLLKHYLAGQLSITGHARRLNTPGRYGLAARLRAEIWLAIAGGAKHINYFTWRGGGEWRSFDVTPEIEEEIAAQNRLINLLAEPLLSREIPVKTRQDSPVRASARLHEGSLYVVTVNSSEEPVTTSFSVDGLDTTRAEVWQENRSLKMRSSN